MLAAMQLDPPLTSCDKLGVDIHNMVGFFQKYPTPRHKYVDANLPRYISYGRTVASSTLYTFGNVTQLFYFTIQ